jgi:hypothetical protein
MRLPHIGAVFFCMLTPVESDLGVSVACAAATCTEMGPGYLNAVSNDFLAELVSFRELFDAFAIVDREKKGPPREQGGRANAVCILLLLLIVAADAETVARLEKS